MVTEEEKEKQTKKLLDELYKKERHEFKQWVCEQVGAVREDRKPGYKYPDGYIDELNTCILAKQTFNVGIKVFEKASLFLGDKEKYKHIIIIAFSFDNKIKELVYTDSFLEVMIMPVERLMMEDFTSYLHQLIHRLDNPPSLSKFFPNLKNAGSR